MLERLYQAFGGLIQARNNCQESGNTEWFTKHSETLEWLASEYLPHGSGIDSGVSIDLEKSKPGRIVFHFGFHHMNQNGFYEGWEYYSLIIRPDFVSGFNMRITGRDRNNIKELLYEEFSHSLNSVAKAQCAGCGHIQYGRMVWTHDNPDHATGFLCRNGHTSVLLKPAYY